MTDTNYQKIKRDMEDKHLNNTLLNANIHEGAGETTESQTILSDEENECMLRVMSMDRLKKNDGENGIKYYRTWTGLVNLINTLFLSGSEEDKKYSKYFINRMAFWLGKQCLDNPYIYVSHGPNHSFEVVEYLEMLYNISPVIKKSLSDLYGLQYEGMYNTNLGQGKSVMRENIIFTKIVLKLLALLHDVGYSDVSENIANPDGQTVDKWVHAMSGVKTIIPEIEEFLKKCITIINNIYNKPTMPEDKPKWRSKKITNKLAEEKNSKHKLEKKKLNLISDFKKAIWYHNADSDKCNLNEFRNIEKEEEKEKWIEKYLKKCTFTPSNEKSSKLFPNSIDTTTVYREYYEGNTESKPFIYLIRAADNLDFTRNRMVNTHKNSDLIQLSKNLYILGETLGDEGKKSNEGRHLQEYLVDRFEKNYTNQDKELPNVRTMFKELKTNKGWGQFEHWYSVFCVLSSDVQSIGSANSGRLRLNVYLDGNLKGDLDVESNKWMSLNQITRLKDALDSIKSGGGQSLTDLIYVNVYKRSGTESYEEEKEDGWSIVGERSEVEDNSVHDELLYEFTLSDIEGTSGPRPSGSDENFLQKLKEEEDEWFLRWGKKSFRTGGRKIKKTKKTKKKKKRKKTKKNKKKKSRRQSQKKHRRKSRR
jgi:hypothetical protein